MFICPNCGNETDTLVYYKGRKGCHSCIEDGSQPSSNFHDVAFIDAGGKRWTKMDWKKIDSRKYNPKTRRVEYAPRFRSKYDAKPKDDPFGKRK